MKFRAITLAAALAVAGTAAFAQTEVHRSVQVGPNGEVTHVTKRVETPNGTRVVHKVRRVTTHTMPVVVHRRVVYEHPHHWHHQHRVIYREHHDHGRHLAYGHRDHDRDVVVHREIIRRNG